jgi:hypothetical protein
MAIFLTAVQAEAGPIAYEYTTGPVNASTPGAPGFAAEATVSGTFKYDPATALTGAGTVPGTSLYRGALSELLGSVQGLEFSDAAGAAVVGDEQTGTPPGTSGTDLLSLIADVRGNCSPCDLQGFVLGGYQLVNVRIFWVEDGSGIPDFLTDSNLPTLLPEFPGKLALDFVSTTGTGPVLNVFFGNVRVRPINAPDPAALLQELALEVGGVGPGMSLVDKVTSAQTYFAVPDAQATCAMLADFTREVGAQRGKKITADLATKLTADAQVIMTAIGCN